MEQVPKTILAQMGGNRALVMIGAQYVTYGDYFLKVTFKAKALAGIRSFRIWLDPSDTYTITFYGPPKAGSMPAIKAEFTDIYCDQLKSLIERTTGLYLSL
jgi:hypothetical protein